jgi:ubiquinone/menaquinone biosynthesis C-methylase UbiE
MGDPDMDAVGIQREYYRSTAGQYDAMHLGDAEHEYALALMVAMIGHLDINSVLDVGSGTGRALSAVKKAHPNVRIVGVEPVKALREQGNRKGLELIDGDAQNLNFPDGSFEMVCAYAVLHHVPDPRRAVREMLRVAKRAVFISDSNNFGQGSSGMRLLKQILRSTGLWKAADFVKTRGKGYTISEGDGLAYSYSIFDDYPQIAARCREVRLFSTTSSGPNLYRTCSHVAILGIH